MHKLSKSQLQLFGEFDDVDDESEMSNAVINWTSWPKNCFLITIG